MVMLHSQGAAQQFRIHAKGGTVKSILPFLRDPDVHPKTWRIEEIR